MSTQVFDTLVDMRSGVQTGLNASDSSSLYPPATIDLAINRAYVNKVSRLFRWPKLESAKTTATQANIENYDLPDKDNSDDPWSVDSAWRLQIGDDYYGEDPDYSPMVFQDFLDWKADSVNASSTDKKWAVHGHQVFIYPTPTVKDLVISMWGQKVAVEMSLDTSTTIFSGTMPEGNEAIVLEAVAMLKKKGEAEQSGQMLSDEAKQILVIAYSKLRQERAKYEKTQPMFNVDDMFASKKGSHPTGNFNL